MNFEDEKNYIRVNKKVLGLVLLVLMAGILGWWLGRSDTPTTTPANNTQSTIENSDSKAAVNELVTYVLPDGWKEVSCAGNGAVFVAPNGTNANCDASPVTPVKLSVDAGNNKDCNQLQNISDVKKHVCISLYINGHESLKASTEYLASSSYKQATSINAYYIDTGKGVVKVEYIFNTNDQFQAGFDQLASSVNTKN